MRDLIVSNIKQFIVLLRERGTTIDTSCVINKSRKSAIIQPEEVIQESDICDTTTSQFTPDVLEMEFNYSEPICNQLDFVQEIDYIFTVNEITTSIVTLLIHVSLSHVISMVLCIKYKNREISDRNTELMSNTYIVVYS